MSTFEARYNASDSITCSAEGLPTPRVRWTRVSGDMSAHSAGTSRMQQAVLTHLENGAHTWTCTATSELGTDAVNVTFTGTLSSVSRLLAFRAAARRGGGVSDEQVVEVI